MTNYKFSSYKFSSVFVLAAALALQAGPATAQDYSGKTVQMVIASNAGGGTDRIGRLFGLYLEKYLPGRPNIVYRNFAAGGGKIRAANFLALQAKADGSTLMQTDASVVTPSTVRRKVSKFDPRTFIPIGGFNAGGSVVFARKGTMKRLTASGKPLVVGAISGSRSWQAMMVWGKEYLGWNLRWIPGYKGTRSLMKALRQGEIDMMATASSKRIDRLLKDGVIELIAQEASAEARCSRHARPIPMSRFSRHCSRRRTCRSSPGTAIRRGSARHRSTSG
jgi:tripartite-type tricarboxylate transporter receptor subunit TctC